MAPAQRFPQRGEIWWTNFHTDPPDKGRRPVIVVSPDSRNRHERATTVLVIPLSTSIHKLGPAHMLLSAGETGLRAAAPLRPTTSPSSCERICESRKVDNGLCRTRKSASWPLWYGRRWGALSFPPPVRQGVNRHHRGFPMGIPAKLKSQQRAIHPPEIPEAPIEWTFQVPSSLANLVSRCPDKPTAARFVQ